jgi:hypothetical protein
VCSLDQSDFGIRQFHYAIGACFSLPATAFGLMPSYILV